MTRWHLVAVPLLVVAAACAEAQPPSIQPLGALDAGDPQSNANGVSADGATVVGESNVAGNGHAFRWRAGSGMVDLGSLEGPTGSSVAFDVSDSGNVIVGQSSATGGVEHAFRWTPGTGMVDLDTIGGVVGNSQAWAVSANGAVVVGDSSNASNGTHAFRWTSGGGMIDLGSFAGAAGFSTAQDVSDNGNVVVGYSYAPASSERRRAFRWKAGVMDDISSPENYINAAIAASGDARYVAGIVSKLPPLAGYRAGLWKPDAAVKTLPAVNTAIANDISDDGGVIVGTTIVIGQGGGEVLEASVWIDEKRQSLAELLDAEGVDLSDWADLSYATSVSANGRVVVGYGNLLISGDTIAFRAVLPNRGPSATTPKVTNMVDRPTKTRVTLSSRVTDPDSASLTARWRVDGVLRRTQTRTPGQTTTLTFDYDNGDTPVRLSVSDGSKSVSIKGVVRVTATTAKFIKDAESSPGPAPAQDSLATSNGSSLDAYRLSGLGLAGSTSGSSLSGYRYAESAILAELYADESEGATGIDAALAHRQLRYAQAVYSQVASNEHLQAFADSGDESQLSAASRWATAAVEASVDLSK